LRNPGTDFKTAAYLPGFRCAPSGLQTGIPLRSIRATNRDSAALHPGYKLKEPGVSKAETLQQALITLLTPAFPLNPTWVRPGCRIKPGSYLLS
jgi:hypothetical protein